VSKGKILAFDCCGSEISVAVADAAGKILSSFYKEQRFGHAADLMPAILKTMDDAETSFQDLKHLVTTRGPGGFTGLRVSLATAMAIKLSSSITGLGFSSFDVSARQVPQDFEPTKPRLVVLDSHRKDVYAQTFDNQYQPVTSPVILALDDAEKMAKITNAILVGNGTTIFSSSEANIQCYFPEEKGLARSLIEIAVRSSNHRPSPLTPIYIRPPDVSLAKVK
jgi:tRNA threonylcarbamoyladenosine biosynthesis protein TsaB